MTKKQVRECIADWRQVYDDYRRLAKEREQCDAEFWNGKADAIRWCAKSWASAACVDFSEAWGVE